MEVFLDNASTTPLLPEVKEILRCTLDVYGNPSSIHSKGTEAKKIIAQSRDNVAKFVSADYGKIVFTPSGSASNMIMINTFSGVKGREHRIFYIPTAHKSIVNHAKTIGAIPLPVCSTGEINIKSTEKMFSILKHYHIAPLVISEYANSEIGTVQDVFTLTNLVHKYNGLIYLDCTGAVSSTPINVQKIGADAIGFSGHKIGALKGVGVLWYNDDAIIPLPLISGSQEGGIIGGTENLLGIISVGASTKYYRYSENTEKNRDYVQNWITENISDTLVVGKNSKRRLHGNLNICFKGVSGEALLLLLDSMGIQVSTGSACNSGSKSPSEVLKVIGFPEKYIHSCIRMSFSGNETQEQLDYVCQCLKICVQRLRKGNK